MPVKPESAGMCSSRLQRIDRFLAERYIDSGRLPFAQLQIARGGQLVHHTLLGKSSLEDGTPLREDSIVRIYSMTKPITSVAFMMLVEQGKVALDDPVHHYIPSWRNLGVYVGGGGGLPGTPPGWLTKPTESPMRIIDLLRHTSGLTYGFQNRTNVDAAYRANKLDAFAREDSLQGLIDGLARVPLEFSPGTAFNYSVSADVLGYLVQQISGQPFDRYLHQHIFAPLGMRDTGFSVDAAQASRLTQCYLMTPEGKLAPAPQLGSFREPPAAPSGGGGLVSTAADFMRFCECLRRGGELDGHRLLGPKTLALMRANHLPDGRDLADLSLSLYTEAFYRGVGFGLGFAMTTDVARSGVAGSVGEYWWGGAASTAFWVDPVEDLCVVFLTQFLPSTLYPLRRELRTLINAAVIDSKA